MKKTCAAKGDEDDEDDSEAYIHPYHDPRVVTSWICFRSFDVKRYITCFSDLKSLYSINYYIMIL